MNVLAAAAFGILGFAEPSLWLLGMGLEASFLFALSTNSRFHKVVDSQSLQSSEEDAESKRRALISTLPPELQRRLLDLSRTCQRVGELNHQTDEFLVETNRDALQRMEWVYLKLLVARNNMTSLVGSDSVGSLTSRIEGLEQELKSSIASESLRQSKQATMTILRERLANVTRRKETLEEIDSDLARIEAQVQLILENAAMQGKPPTISADLELASNLASTNLFGDAGGTVADLDRSFGTRPQVHE